jgi:hypothetical protein
VVYHEGDRAEETSSGGNFLGESLGFVARIVARELTRDGILSLLDDVDVD